VVLPQDSALDHVYCECRQQLFACALAITRCPNRAEDAVHEAFCRLFRLGSRPNKLKAYVFRAVRNAALDQARQNPSLAEANSEFIFDLRPGPCDTAIEKEFQRQVTAAMMALSPDECETIVQHLYGNLTFREIAEVRQSPLGTVTTWYQRGLRKLRTTLKE
jgi:RNA polymerase sigma-70 factor, ECF subfamily